MTEHQNNEPQAFDHNEVYENEIRPLIRQIHEICRKNDIGMIASFVTEFIPGDENDPENSEGRWGTQNTANFASERAGQNNPDVNVNAPDQIAHASALLSGYGLHDLVMMELMQGMGAGAGDGEGNASPEDIVAEALGRAAESDDDNDAGGNTGTGNGPTIH